MRPTVFLALLVVLLPTASAARAGMTVESTATIDLSEYETYAWQQGKPAARQGMERRVHDAVTEQLQARGLRTVDGGADLRVRTYVLVDEHTLEELSDTNRWRFVTGITSVTAYDLRLGTLVVDLVDGGSDRVLWRGLVSEDLSGKPASNEKKIDKAVRKLFKRLDDSRP